MLKFGLNFDWLTVVSAGIDLVAILVALSWPASTDANNSDASMSDTRRLAVDWQRLMRAALVGGFVFVGKLVPFAFLGVHAFGMIRLIYIEAVVVLPLVGVFLLLRSSLRPVGTTPAPRLIRGLAVLLIGLAGVGYYTSYYEPFNLQLERPVLEVQGSRKPKVPIRIGILADIQTNDVTDYERHALRRLAAEAPDLVLIPGDLFQGTASETEAEVQELVELLQLIDAPAGSFFVTGDVDHRYRIKPILRKAGVRLLDHRIQRLMINDSPLLIAGVALDYRSDASLQTIRELESMPADDALKILMAHRPGVVRHLSDDSDIDLVVAGHTHGGQVVVPGLGPPITLSVLPRAIAKGGLHEFNGHALYISRGVGCERGQSPRIRFCCPPEITLLTLR